jgi:hypothetical protein
MSDNYLLDIVNSSLEGSVVRVQLSGLPSVSVDLSPNSPSMMSPLLKALRPRIIVMREGLTEPIIDLAPYGDPEQGTPWGLIALGLVGLIVLWVCWK